MLFEERGHNRESLFWIAVTHSRCQKLLGDLRVPSTTEVRRRCADVALILLRVWHLAEDIMAVNREI